MDVTDVSSVKGVVDDVFVRFGRIDVLVNNAGVIFSKPMVNLSQPSNLMHDYDSFRSSVTSNMDSVFIVTSAIVEKMVWRRTRGAVINISSISACGNAGQTAYSAAKAGVNAMTVTWSKELGKLGIRCNAVAPGFFDTTSTNHSLAPEIKTHIQRNTPLQRFGDKEEIARAISFVIENDYMNGAVLNIDGGLRL
jgi:3-oxoacyl-[acyl-carrier protein] reductase